jgi:hypothetical protein
LFANVDNSTLEISGGAIQVKDNGIALGTKTTGDYVADIYSGDGITLSGGTGEGSTPTISITAGEGLIANGAGLFVNSAFFGGIGSSDVSFVNLQVYGNTVLGDAIQDRVTLNASLYGTVIPTVDNAFDIGSVGAIYNTGYFTQLRLGSTSDTFITATANTIDVHNLTVNSNFIANTATVYHDFYVGGDLHITGNAVFANVESYIVTDPLIQLGANNNLTDLLDIGFFGNYGTDGNTAHHKHTGLFRDASDGIYKLFTNLDVAPTTVVATGDASYTQATLQAYLNSGALVSNSTTLNITGTSGIAVAIVANSISLSTPLAATSGGTGQNTYTTGDLLYASSSSALSKLSTGGSSNYGYVLQVNGSGVPTWDTLDGGTF